MRQIAGSGLPLNYHGVNMGHSHRFFTSYVAGNLVKLMGPYLLKLLTVIRDEKTVVFGARLTESHHGITQ